MKVIILAGGLGTRIAEETHRQPKPLVEIGNFPILWHIMKIYDHYDIRDFVICLGYKGHMIKNFFLNYHTYTADFTINLTTMEKEFIRSYGEDWRVTLVDTGLNTMTASRIKKVEEHIKDEECFCLTYGDGLCDVNIAETIKFHKNHKKLATILAVRPAGRFGALKIEDTKVTNFEEKPLGDGGYINGGFFVLSPKITDYIPSDRDDVIWEQEPLSKLAEDGQLQAYHHQGFWHPMDTLKDRNHMEDLWNNNQAAWKKW